VRRPQWTLTTHPGLDESLLRELAELAGAEIRGYSDDRPVDSRLIRSRLFRPSDDAEPVACLVRGRTGRLIGWAAMRQQDTYESHARLWGPIVTSDSRGQGVGARILSALLIQTGGIDVITTDVPHDRAWAIDFFRGRGWSAEVDRAVLTVDSQANDARLAGWYPGEVSCSSVDGSILDAFVARAATAHSAIEQSLASTVLARWRRDHRFSPDLVLGHPEHPCLLLLLPQDAPGTSELLFAELWSDRDDCRNNLIATGMNVMESLGCCRARAVVDVKGLPPFLSNGFREAGRSTQFVHARAYR